MAAAPALGATESEIQSALLEPPADPFLDAIQSLLAPAGEWTGPATALVALLPYSPHYSGLTNITRYLGKRNASLKAAAIDFEKGRSTKGGREIRLRFDRSASTSVKMAANPAGDETQPTDPESLIAA